jgi:ribosomal-protein-alanine N-acetyltransferase
LSHDHQPGSFVGRLYCPKLSKKWVLQVSSLYENDTRQVTPGCLGLLFAVTSLANDRIRLEPLTAAHAGELFPLLADRQVYRFIPDEPPPSVAALAERYRRLESRRSPDRSQQWLNWAIRRLEDGQCAGYLQATIHPGGTADFAFVLGPPFWGLGLARAASVLALQALFDGHGVVSVFATTDQRNLRSSGLLTSLGFVRVPPASHPYGKVSVSDYVFQLDKNVQSERDSELRLIASRPPPR